MHVTGAVNIASRNTPCLTHNVTSPRPNFLMGSYRNASKTTAHHYFPMTDASPKVLPLSNSSHSLPSCAPTRNILALLEGRRCALLLQRLGSVAVRTMWYCETLPVVKLLLQTRRICQIRHQKRSAACPRFEKAGGYPCRQRPSIQ